MSESQGSREGTYVLKPGTRLYIRAIGVSDEYISFHIYTMDAIKRTVAGTTRSDRYTAMIRYEFPKNYLASATFDDIQNTIAAVLATDAQAAAAKTIELGQTFAQVEGVLGKPENTVKLGTKTIYTYKTMKVIFVDGKVCDVQ